MATRKLYNARNELFALMLFCENAQTAAKMSSIINNKDWFCLKWAQEAYVRIKERYSRMEISDGVLPFTSLIADDELSEETRNKLEQGRKKFKSETIDPTAVVRSLEKFRKFRLLNILSSELNNALGDDSITDPSVLIDQINDTLLETQAAGKSMADSFLTLGKGFNAGKVLESILNDEEDTEYVPTGMREFDERNGGITYGSAVMIGGNTGGGKTLIAWDVAQHMALYESVCYVPLEMTNKQMLMRMMAAQGKVKINKIVSHQWTNSEKERAVKGVKNYQSVIKEQGNRLTLFKPSQPMSMEEVLLSLHPYNYRVIIIDYTALLKGMDGEDTWRKLDEASRAAKIYATTNSCIVILLAQLNDEGKLRASTGMLAHFDNAFFFVANQSTKEDGFVSVSQPKARNQDPTGYELEIDYHYMRIAKESKTDSGIYKLNFNEDTEKPRLKKECKNEKTIPIDSIPINKRSEIKDAKEDDPQHIVGYYKGKPVVREKSEDDKRRGRREAGRQLRKRRYIRGSE